MEELISKNIYHLPFSENLSYAPQPAPYHKTDESMKHALDFALGVGSEVYAAHDGIVFDVKDGSDEGGPDLSFADKSNYVVLAHPNNEYTYYYHLQRGIFVRKGEEVSAGKTLIGRVGITGYTTYSHLHFNVLSWHEALGWQSAIPRFRKDGEVFTLCSPD